MAEKMLREVRRSFYFVGCFYGHPGVFVNPSHRAIAIAANEGFSAVMLPGVSAEDCPFADLLLDTSRPGCQTLEATDLLIRERPVATYCHVVLFQVGAVGGLGFNFKGFKNTKFSVLVKRLLDVYGPKHPVVHYVASQLSTAAPLIQRYTIEDLQLEEVANRVTGISTSYFPPKDMLTFSQTATTDDGKPLPAESYIGPQFYGNDDFIADSPPSASNIFGKVGVAPRPKPGPVELTPISTWFAAYRTFIKGADGKHAKDDTLVIGGDDSNATVTYKGTVIQNYTYSNETTS